MRGEPVWKFSRVKFDVAVQPRGEALIQCACWCVDLGVRLHCAIIRRPAGEILGDAVVSEPTRHFTTRAQDAKRNARPVVLGLHEGFGVSERGKVLGVDVWNTVSGAPDHYLL